MIRRFFALFLLCMLVPIVARADFAGPSQKIPLGGTLRGTFVEEHFISNSKKPLRSEGHFLIAPGKGILWLIEKPVPLTFIVTPDGFTQTFGTIPILHTPSSKVPLIGRVTEMIGAALAGDWGALENDFAVRRNVVPGGWTASITPHETTKGMPFKSLTIAGKEYVESARVMRRSEGLDKFTFADQKASASPPTEAELETFKLATAAKK